MPPRRRRPKKKRSIDRPSTPDPGLPPTASACDDGGQYPRAAIGVGRPALKAPIEKIPTEVLVEVFLHTWETSKGPSRMQIAVLLSQVSWQWRRISLDLHVIWSYISVRYSYAETPLVPSTQLLKAFLHRSQQLPLTLKVTAVDNGFKWLDVSCSTRTMSAIIPHAGRWQSITFNMPIKHLEPLARIPLHGLPLLETFFAFRPKAMERGNLFTRFGALSSAPRLRRIGFEFMGLVHMPLELPWAQLTDVILEGFHMKEEYYYTYHDFFTVLQRCPKLTYYRQMLQSADEYTRTAPLFHPALTSLVLNSVISYDTIFNHVTLPNLKSLDLFGHKLQWSSRPFIQFLSHSQCTITSLTLAAFIISDREIACLLQYLVSLEELTLLFKTPELDIDRLLYDLTFDSSTSSRPLCPNLQSLEVRGVEFSEDALVGMVHSRCLSRGPKEDEGLLRVAPLQNLAICETSMEASVMESLISCCGEGLCLTFIKDRTPWREEGFE
ncbi:hypothetical protein JAAARDRAFT_650742 [Jaapia argillacea MUCL 33604]|uniref:F-box domain-containing protein n=1 Tax=Jaapia argillacea MUCL 33604 TaxID=933084 RepID=A0A067Q6C6_9AGAM|nr:hypothetical protein JAAARDRAFT_650742 [Jaapia argillacea MUCL 33604]